MQRKKAPTSMHQVDELLVVLVRSAVRGHKAGLGRGPSMPNIFAESRVFVAAVTGDNCDTTCTWKSSMECFVVKLQDPQRGSTKVCPASRSTPVLDRALLTIRSSLPPLRPTIAPLAGS